jgi:hypothetical protein
VADRPTNARCPSCKRLFKRSHAANSRYWAILHLIAERVKPEGQTFSAETWHTWAKSKFLGCDEVKLPSGRTLIIPRSSADLDVAEFSDLMTKLEVWANDQGVYMEDIAA